MTRPMENDDIVEEKRSRRAEIEDWTARAKKLFGLPKPDHFTNYRHCCECAEHDETLRNSDVDTIGMQELGSPAWDPLCFTNPAGLQYYLPAMVRLTLATMATECYAESLLCHLIKDGEHNEFVTACSWEQRIFVSEFLAWLVETYAEQLTIAGCDHLVLHAHDIWHCD